MPAEPGALQGYDPSFVVVDELHVVTEQVRDAMALASGKRDRSLVLGIPGVSPNSVMWRLVQHGREGDDPSFHDAEFAAPQGGAVNDEQAWAVANADWGIGAGTRRGVRSDWEIAAGTRRAWRAATAQSSPSSAERVPRMTGTPAPAPSSAPSPEQGFPP